MTSVDGISRSGYEEQLHRWIASSTPVNELQLSGVGEGSEGARATDTALRNVLWDLLDAHGHQSNGSLKDADQSAQKMEAAVLGRFVDVMVALCEREMASPNLPATVFTDLFDTLTISRCERLFQLVEERVELWKRPAFFAPCKNQLLRMCNDLLRRLSKGQNTVFCGQILIVLAKLFPLSERSGLNIVSEFNTEHLTIRSDQLAADEDIASSAGQGDDKEGNIIDKESVSTSTADNSQIVDVSGKVSQNLYRKFWSLQEFFRQPNLCYNANHWKQMTKCSQEVLTVFSSFRLDEQGTSSKPTEAYFAKYLTSKKLFELELSDSNFRRCILIQFLIMFHYLKASVRFKLESQVLSEEQSQWVKEKSAEIYKLLEQTPPDGKEFARSIAAMMAREEMWNAWKNDNCPAFRVADAPERKLVRRKRPIGDDIRDHLAKGQISMGSAELTRLFNICPDNWEACRGEARNYVPSMEDFFMEAIAQADPAACIEDQYKLTSNPNWGWRALRILSQKSLHFFTSTNQPAKSLPNYLDTMVGYLAKDISVTKEGSKENSNGATSGVKVEEVDDNSQDDFKDEYADNNAQVGNQSSAGNSGSTGSGNRQTGTGASGASAGQDEDDGDDVDGDGNSRGSTQNNSASNNNEKEGEPVPKRTRLAVSRSAAASSASGEGSNATLSANTISRLAAALGADCARLVPHMGLSDDELQYVQSQHGDDPVAQATHLLTLWKENEPEDATLEKARQIAAKLGLTQKLTDAALKG